MKNIKCIIFDCDGVLVDSEAIGNQVLMEMAKEFGLQMSMEDAFLNFNGRSLQHCFQHIEETIGQKLPETFETAYRQKSFEAFKNNLQPIEGVKEFIAQLKVPFCVASSGPVEKIILNLTTVGLIDQFENKIFSAYQINKWKPEPDLFLLAAKKMGFQVDECIVIEDSEVGIMAAKNGGFKVFALSNGNNKKDLEQQGAIVFDNFKELESLINIHYAT